LRAGPSDRHKYLVPVIGTKRSDFDRATVAKMLDDQIIGSFRHEKWFPLSSNQQAALLALFVTMNSIGIEIRH